MPDSEEKSGKLLVLKFSSFVMLFSSLATFVIFIAGIVSIGACAALDFIEFMFPIKCIIPKIKPGTNPKIIKNKLPLAIDSMVAFLYAWRRLFWLMFNVGVVRV